jgi:hypothetical protein
MNFINNWQRSIALAIADTEAALDLPDGIYCLCISNADRTQFEVIEAEVSGGVAELYRGIEGTSAQEWPPGSLIYCGVTAGTLDRLQSYFGDGSPTGVVIAPAGCTYIDQSSREAWMCIESGTFNDEPFSDWAKIKFDD